MGHAKHSDASERELECDGLSEVCDDGAWTGTGRKCKDETTYVTHYALLVMFCVLMDYFFFGRAAPWYTNPQTEAFCRMLELENKINPPPPGVSPTPGH
jgi:hypothetical protein